MSAFLIDIDTLKKIGYVNKNVENNIIATTLRRVQDTMLLPILGTTFFNHLCSAVDNTTLTIDETSLLNEYITPFLCSAVDLRIINPLTYEIRSKTVGTTRDEHINGVTISENHLLSEDLRSDMDVYRLRLVGFLKDNCLLFPSYNEFLCDFESIAPDRGEQRLRVRF